MLTARQQEIWGFLVDYVDRHGYPPTVREIGEAVGLASPSTVHAHLANLERSGLLKRDPTKPRALELIGHRRSAPAAEPAEDMRGIHRLPLVGQVAAVFHVIISAALIGLVLMHSGRDTGFGGMGFTPQSQGGTHIVERNLTRLTVAVATVFFLNSVLLYRLLN